METTEPTSVYQLAVANYASVGALAVLIWDILDNIPADYRVLFHNRPLCRKLTLANCVYISSRIGALGYQLVGVVFQTAPVRHCALLSDIAFGWCPLSFGATGLLFFLRLQAVYHDNRIVVNGFFILWLGLLVSGILLPIGFRGGPMGETPYCTHVSMSTVAFYSQLAPVIFDTLVFLAISWRLSRRERLDEASTGADIQTLDEMLSSLNHSNFDITRGLLIDGQIYYLLTVVPGIVSAILALSSFVPKALSDFPQDIYLVLVNIMACRVFRRMRSKHNRGSENSTIVYDQNISTRLQFSHSTDHISSDDIASKDELQV